MRDFVEDQMPHKKKAKKKHIKKADHKHDFQPCVFSYPTEKYDKHRGMYPATEESIGSYCTICGKIGEQYFPWVFEFVPMRPGAHIGRYERTEDAKRELNPETRTFPTFHLNDYFRDKFIPDFGGETV